MRRILGVSGFPGTGKSTLMIDIINELGPSTRQKFGLLEYTQFKDVNVLGYYEKGNLFGGTDRLSMSVQDNAVEYLNSLYRLDPDRALAFEGDRLTNSEFLRLARSVGELRFVVLTCSEKTLVGRREARSEKAGKEQNATWLKGRESKVYRLQTDFDAEIRSVNTQIQGMELAKELRSWLLGLTSSPERKSSRLF